MNLGVAERSFESRALREDLTRRGRQRWFLAGVVLGIAALFWIWMLLRRPQPPGTGTVADAVPLHHYAFEDAAVTDSIGSAHGRLLRGAVVEHGMLSLNGQSAYVEFDESLIPTSGDFSVSFFAQELSPTSDRAEMISQGRWFGPGFYIGYYPAPRFGLLNRLISRVSTQQTADRFSSFFQELLRIRHPLRRFRLGDDWQVTELRFPSDQKWHHYALTMDKSGSRFFIDGVLVAKSKSIGIAAGGNNTRLGRQYEPWPEYFHGNLAEFWIYQGTLRAEEVKMQAAARLGHGHRVIWNPAILVVAVLIVALCVLAVRAAKRRANQAPSQVEPKTH